MLVPFLATAVLSLTAAAAAGPAPTQSKPTVAVLSFDYGGKDAGLDPLREGLAQMLISDVPAFASVNVVERVRLKAVLEEQKLGRSGKIDPATAARVGKLLGARVLVLGNYFDLGASMRLDARVVEVETGKIVRAVGVNGASNDFLGMEQELAGKLGDALTAALPELSKPSELPKVDKPAKPKSGKVKSTTVATYGRALLALDEGKQGVAKALLTEVVKEAPEFALAKSDLNALLQ